MNQGQYQGIVAELQAIKALLQQLVDRQTPTLGLGALPVEPVAENDDPLSAEPTRNSSTVMLGPKAKGAKRGAKLPE